MVEARSPIDRVVDLVIAMPTCLLVATRRAAPIAVRASWFGAVRFVERLGVAVQERMLEESPPVPAPPVAGGERVDVQSSIDPGDLPIDGYDDLAARQVVDRLAALGPADLARVEVYEREHRHRSTVLGKISMLRS